MHHLSAANQLNVAISKGSSPSIDVDVHGELALPQAIQLSCNVNVVVIHDCVGVVLINCKRQGHLIRVATQVGLKASPLLVKVLAWFIFADGQHLATHFAVPRLQPGKIIVS